ncbi:hypothetical protein T12_13629 [Trichinella patagoniensis]|uniref:Uncharacterized protein n=1 Tax=Trichinella patagoniensis TaxID=990121 RepID=A0A0V0XCU9_9BILA|nr:hypothetical protein T12_13629 [Trichinella patagoniensis]
MMLPLYFHSELFFTCFQVIKSIPNLQFIYIPKKAKEC